MKKINVRLPITIIEAGQVPFFAAKELGFYAEKGLDVDLTIGDPRANSLDHIAEGKFDIGVLGGPDTLIKARSDGYPLKAFALLHHDSNFPCILSLKKSDIKTLQDLNNKKVGFYYGHVSTEILRNLFKQEGITVEEIDAGFNYQKLLNGEVDAMWAFRVTAAVEFQKKEIPVNIINPADYGISSHGYTLFAGEKTLENEYEEIKAFTEATYKGLQYSIEQPEEAVRFLLAADPYLDTDLNLTRLKMYNEVTATEPYGLITKELLDSSYKRLKNSNQLNSDFDLNDVIAKEFHGGKKP